MKALSLWQPWASLLVHGAKRVETRGWPIRHRGPLLIHAAKKWTGELRAVCESEPFLSALGACLRQSTEPDRDTGFPFGAIIGSVNVVGCYSVDDISFHHDSAMNGHQDERGGREYLVVGPREAKFGDYAPGRFAFLCTDFCAFKKPIPYRGAQGLFDVPSRIVSEAA